jgi:hypothetical protein
MRFVSHHSSSREASSRKSTSPYGSRKASAITKGKVAQTSGASRNESKLSQGTACFSDSVRAILGFLHSRSTTSQINSISSSNTNLPLALNESPDPTNEAANGAFVSVHFRNRDMASSPDELIFLRAIINLGFERATILASKSHWQCQRPLRALLAAMNEPGKSYTKQNATRKPHGGAD